MSFESFVGTRYLRAKRKQKFISVVTLIAIAGIALGVMALVVAVAINTGVQQDLQHHLLSAVSHISLLEKQRGFGIENWPAFIASFENLENVVAVAPALYGEVMITGPTRGRASVLKGIDPRAELQVGTLLDKLAGGSIDGLELSEKPPGIILGQKLAQEIGAVLHATVTVVSPQGDITPYGVIPGYKRFRVVGIFESGFYEYNHHWAFARIQPVQQSLALADVINAVEFKLDDLHLASQVGRNIEKIAGKQFAATTWMERNRDIFNALQVEKLVTTITIGLIMLVAALNILTSLVMIVMEKKRDIAILMSMGARKQQIRKIFVSQGLAIGTIGTGIGLVVGQILCRVSDSYRLISLDAEIYGLSYVPFSPTVADAVLIGAASIALSYVTTLYPAGAAAQVTPVETLRYE